MISLKSTCKKYPFIAKQDILRFSCSCIMNELCHLSSSSNIFARVYENCNVRAPDSINCIKDLNSSAIWQLVFSAEIIQHSVGHCQSIPVNLLSLLDCVVIPTYRSTWFNYLYLLTPPVLCRLLVIETLGPQPHCPCSK